MWYYAVLKNRECICVVNSRSDAEAFGENYQILELDYVPETYDPANEKSGKIFTDEEIRQNKWEQIRRKRNELLLASDWTVIPDSPLSEVQKQLWKLYRQALRDIPQTYIDPGAVRFPPKPVEKIEY